MKEITQMKTTKTLPTETNDSLLSESEVAERLQAARRTVVNWRMQGEIPYIRVGRLIRYHWPSVLDHLLWKASKNSGVR